MLIFTCKMRFTLCLLWLIVMVVADNRVTRRCKQCRDTPNAECLVFEGVDFGYREYRISTPDFCRWELREVVYEWRCDGKCDKGCLF
jgi:hypothetical protein